MKKSIFLFLMIIFIDAGASEDRLTLWNRVGCYEDLHSRRVQPNRPMMILFKSMAISADFSRVQVNFKELYSKIDYSVWYDVNTIKNLDFSSAIDFVAKEIKTRSSTDSVFNEKLKNEYFCLGLLNNIQKNIPDSASRRIGNKLNFLSQMKKVTENHINAMLHLERSNDVENRLKLFSIKKDTSSDLYIVKCQDESYEIDLGWTYCWRPQGELVNLLEIMITARAMPVIDELLATGRFDLNALASTKKTLLMEADTSVVFHLLTRYKAKIDINKKDFFGNTALTDAIEVFGEKIRLSEQYEQLKSLLALYEAKIDINKKDFFEDAALIWNTKNLKRYIKQYEEKLSHLKSSHTKIVILLVRGADPEIRNGQGLNAFDIAGALGDQTIISCLEKSRK